MENRNSPTSGRAQQERRASARRGTGIAPATPNTSLPNEDAHMPRGAYAPPLLAVLQCGDLLAELRLLRCTNAGLQERRASARRGNGVEPWMVNRKPTSGRAQQERRASARRGNETHLQWREFFPERVRSRTTGGLRPPLLVACADVIADVRFAPTSTHLFPRLAYVSRSWWMAMR
jgi:hypothetical protein